LSYLSPIKKPVRKIRIGTIRTSRLAPLFDTTKTGLNDFPINCNSGVHLILRAEYENNNE
jgi:hypothetical protein